MISLPADTHRSLDFFLGDASQDDIEHKERVAWAYERFRHLASYHLRVDFPRLADAGIGTHTVLFQAVGRDFLEGLISEEIRDETHFKNWARMRIKWALLALAKKLKNSPASLNSVRDAVGLPSECSYDPVDRRRSSVEQIEAADYLTSVLKAVEGLPLDLKEVFELYYLEGLKQGEIAKRLGVTQPRVSQRLAQAVMRLPQPS